MESQIVSEIMNFYDEKIHFLIESVNVNITLEMLQDESMKELFYAGRK